MMEKNSNSTLSDAQALLRREYGIHVYPVHSCITGYYGCMIDTPTGPVEPVIGDYSYEQALELGIDRAYKELPE